MAENRRWSLDIQHGPEGGADYAWVFAGKELVGVMRTHHAAQVVEAVNAYAIIQRSALTEGRKE